jgi:hypothetical protein
MTNNKSKQNTEIDNDKKSPDLSATEFVQNLAHDMMCEMLGEINEKLDKLLKVNDKNIFKK